MENIEIKRLTEYDTEGFKNLIILFKQIFEHEDHLVPSKLHLEGLLGRSDFVALTVSLNNEIVGGLTAYALQKYYSEESEFFIYDIAVRTDLQRSGLGKRLLSTLKEYAKQNKIKDIFVAAHKEDQHALDFYHSTGGQSESVVHFNYFVKK